jgi:hypothetical protein
MNQRKSGEGIVAGWWAVGALACFIAGIGGLVKGIWLAALFLPAGVVLGAVALRRGRERNF